MGRSDPMGLLCKRFFLLFLYEENLNYKLSVSVNHYDICQATLKKTKIGRTEVQI